MFIQISHLLQLWIKIVTNVMSEVKKSLILKGETIFTNVIKYDIKNAIKPLKQLECLNECYVLLILLM